MYNPYKSILKILPAIFLFGSLCISAPAFADTGTAPNSSVSSNTSANWAGYVADSATVYSAVGGTWNVPTPSSVSTTPLATDATWVGIGGVKSRDLIQAGTQAVIQNGSISYQGWYEALPGYQQQVPLTIEGGDSVTVSLTESSNNIWHLSFKDNTTGGDYEKDISYTSSQSSAEWIEEMPMMQSGRGMSYIPLDNFGTLTFTNTYAVADGNRVSAAESGAQSMTMVAGGLQTLATTSALASDSSFSIVRSTMQPSQVLQQLAFVSTRGSHRGFGGRQVIVLFSSGGMRILGR